MNDPKVMGIDLLTGLPAQELREDDQARKLVAALDGLVRSIRDREARMSAFRATIHEQAREIKRLWVVLTSASAKPCELSVRGKSDTTCQEFYATRGELWCAACIARAALKETP